MATMVRYIVFSAAIFLAIVRLSDAHCPGQCPAGGSWRNALCSVKWDGALGAVEVKPCKEMSGGDGSSSSNLECRQDGEDDPDNGLYDIHKCLQKNCSGHGDCRTFCGADGKCEATPNDLARAGHCQRDSECLGGFICCNVECFGMGICQPVPSCKKRALCEVVYTDGQEESRPCLDSPDFMCVDDPDITTAAILNVASIKRCTHKRCSNSSECVGVCEGPGLCDPNREDQTQGKLGTFYAGECVSDSDCIGGYTCCLDMDFYRQDREVPWLCQPSEVCLRNEQDEDDIEGGENDLFGNDDSGANSLNHHSGLVALMWSLTASILHKSA